MTATSAGSSSCPPAKGLDISLAALQRQDPYINNIVDVASQVALYTYNNRANEWEKTEVEGTLFIYTRLASPRHGFTIMNRLSMENLTEPITKDLDFQLQHPFLLYRNARLVIHGIWFYDKEDCQRIAQRMKTLTQQEQTLAHSQGGWLSPGGGGGVVLGGVGRGGGGRGGGGGGGGKRGGGEGERERERGGGGGGGGRGEAKAVDIIQMLTKARTEYDKSTSEPKEIDGSSILCGNPNLIKPIPVKPNTQHTDGAEPKSLSLATLFGFQTQHHHSPKPNPVSPLAFPLEGSSAGRAGRPPVARTLTYEGAVNSSKGGNVAMVGCPDRENEAATGGKDGRNVVGGLQQSQHQHCPAIQKLMQGQRGAGSAVGVLQTVSESPENRLCDNGVPLEHHHLHHLFHHHQQQQQQQQQHHSPHHQHHQHTHQHHHQQQQQQLHPDPIKRLFQTQPLPSCSSSSTLGTAAAPPCCSIPTLQQDPHVPSQPVMVDSTSCPHLPAQLSQHLGYNLPTAQPEPQHNSHSAPTIQGTGLLPCQLTNDQVLQPSQGLSLQMPGVVSPHELLQKLQLVQQEQNLASHNPSRPCPGLAPRFLGPTQAQASGSSPTAGQKAALQFQVISPQRIPATVAPEQLLSPSMFTQAKSSSGLVGFTQESSPAHLALAQPPQQDGIRVLSKSQLQATLLNLIQTDSSFLDTIYEAYVSRFADNTSSKY